ncbi:MAG: IS1634 family transposase, partial [Rhodoferax sp.]|nr:IS1634 family transposase [Rhodoferax sp.]
KVQSASKEVVHARYKDLAHVEWAFRTSKTVLEMRPLYVRLASRTRGHALVVMLAYRLIQELAKRWRNLDVTVAEGIAQLTTLYVHELSVKGVENRQVVSCVPIPNEAIQKLFEHAGIKLPQPPTKEVKISTKRKLTSQRK